MTFTLRTLAIVVVAIAIALGALVNPTATVAAVVVNGVLGAVLVAACLAVATPQPGRSFWLGFSLACLWTLALDELGRREVIAPVVFTSKLESIAERVMPSLDDHGNPQGEPGSTLFFRTDKDRLPIKYFLVDGDGKAKRWAFANMDHLQRKGLVEEMGSMEDLPHVNSIPTARDRSTIFRYMLASFVGLLGGFLSYGVRYRAQSRARGS